MENVIEIIESICEDICDNRCKYPSMYGEEDDDLKKLFEEHCNECLLNKLH